MKKLLFTIITPLTMVCCQSENTEELFETQEKEVNCLFAVRTAEGEFTSVQNHWRNAEHLDGYSHQLPSGKYHDFHCFDVSKYTTEEMVEMVKDKY